jgi:hypothetical protein
MRPKDRDAKLENLVKGLERLRDTITSMVFRDQILKRLGKCAPGKITVDPQNELFLEDVNQLLREIHVKQRMAQRKRFISKYRPVRYIKKKWRKFWKKDDGLIPVSYLKTIEKRADSIRTRFRSHLSDQQDQMNFFMRRSRRRGDQSFNDIFQRRFERQQKYLKRIKDKKIRPVLHLNHYLSPEKQAENLMLCLNTLANSEGPNAIVEQYRDQAIELSRSIAHLQALEADYEREMQAAKERSWLAVRANYRAWKQGYGAEDFKKAKENIRLVCQMAEKLILQNFIGFGKAGHEWQYLSKKIYYQVAAMPRAALAPLPSLKQNGTGSTLFSKRKQKHHHHHDTSLDRNMIFKPRKHVKHEMEHREPKSRHDKRH